MAERHPADREPEYYTCPRVIVSPRLTGKLDDDVWGHAPWTTDFVDIEGDRRPAPRYLTRAKMLWDDDCFYVGAYLEEPHICGWITEHDAVMYHDNDFEVFLDPPGRGHHYGELEVNALNATWDLMLTHPYRAGGFAISGWEIHGVRTAVHLDGTLNNPSDTDHGWSVELAIPWTSLKDIGGDGTAPNDGDQWRVNFSRVEWRYDVVDNEYVKVPQVREDNWVWSPQFAIDMHRPERWGVVQFSSQVADLPDCRPIQNWEHRLALIEIWEAQQRFRDGHGTFAASLGELDLSMPDAQVEGSATQFEAVVGSMRVNQDLYFTRR